MFKKLFGGKREKKTQDGTNVYTYEDAKGPDTHEVAEMIYTEEIGDYFESRFPNRTTSVFHEIISDVVHIDVNVMEPTEEEPFRVLYTTGMSDLPMTLPAELEQEYGHLKRAELMIFLPEDWPITSDAFEDECNYWPIRLMKQLARFPHLCRTWLGYGHTIPNGGDYEPYADGTRLSGTILASPGEVNGFSTKDGTRINIYSLVPLYREEMEFKLENGLDALFEKLEAGVDGSGFWIESDRGNVCR